MVFPPYLVTIRGTDVEVIKDYRFLGVDSKLEWSMLFLENA